MGTIFKNWRIRAQRLDDASNDVQRKQLDEIRKDMEYIISVAEAHAGRCDNKIVKKKKT